MTAKSPGKVLTALLSSGIAAVAVVGAPAIAAPPVANSVPASTQTATQNPLCKILQPFYWEIGDQNGALASGSVGTTSSGPVVSTTNVSIASASKLLYAAYVTQIRGAASNLTADDINFLHFTSGYTTMDENTTGSVCPPTLVPDTINQCLTLTNPSTGAPYSAQDPTTVGEFYYSGGHMENHAAQFMGLGNVAVTALANSIFPELGAGLNFKYTEPLMSGGVATNAATYAVVLRNILNGSLFIHDALGTYPVCTLQSATCTAGYTPLPLEAWSYSIGHWVENNPATNGDGAFSSAGSMGFYPWIDASKTYYGLLSRSATNGGYPSAQCGRLIRRAFMTGIVQTAKIPTN